MPGLTTIPQDDATRKAAPMFRGLLGYFPWACFKIAAHSLRSDRKHNPEKPASEAPHWRREASTDHPDCIVRHLADAWGPRPDDFQGTELDWEEYHLTALAWRANALLQEFGEAKRGAAPGCRSVFPTLGHPGAQTVYERLQAHRKEGGPDVVVKTPSGAHVLVSHPAQKLAVAAFTAEELRRRSPFAGLTGGPDDFPGDEYQPTEQQP